MNSEIFEKWFHGDIKSAKYYNNVIGTVIFDIPLENISTTVTFKYNLPSFKI